jgi:hypothetical protein
MELCQKGSDNIDSILKRVEAFERHQCAMSKKIDDLLQLMRERSAPFDTPSDFKDEIVSNRDQIL